ncbi:Lipid II flippase FtsW [Neochlamydia sp. TUME1]|uniref:peptidoglycan glycosyltransferase FtsW n=1 Tax=Neochlamydia sp. TUME1 TaxID=1478174 RepID=UPI000583DCBF|nr:putative peptidoglycan glycosyltransferase FtsW [Neochlamydia sp. TUME1]KIC76654.1 Lipid II flippase FtsW [Neochlamydia sp. TUME1]
MRILPLMNAHKKVMGKKSTLSFPPIFCLLFLCVSIIYVLGLIMVYSTTSAEVMDMELNKSTHQALIKQLMYAGIGLSLAGGIAKIGYRTLITLSPWLLGIFSFLLFITLIPGIGREVNGSRRWLAILGLSLQPSEFVKYIIPAYFIHHYLKFSGKAFTFYAFLKLVGTIAIPMLLILVEPNNGTTAVIAMSVLVLCILMKISWRYWALPLLACLCVGGAFAYHLSYVSARLKVYLNPELDLKGKGHQPYQAKIAAGSGRLLGRGPGNSMQKLSYLPEAQNDYIAAIYAEEFGFIGVCILITLYLSIACLGFYIANASSSLEGFYFCAVITFLVTFQAFLNLGVVSGLLPSTGLNLPWFSQGGSSLVANILGLGIILNISQHVKGHLSDFSTIA